MKWKVLPCFIILVGILLEYPSVVAQPLPIQHSQRGDGTPVYHWFADVPVLHKGDFWNYTVSATERNYDMDLNGYMNSTVVNITTLPTPRYIIRGSSHLEGEFKYLIFTIQVKVDILSETVVSASNLAQISSTTKVVLDLDPDPLSLGGTTWYNLTFRPPPEEIDFPLAVGKVWNYSSQVYDGSKTTYYNDTLEVRSILNRTVPAGEFTCAAIFSKPSGTFRYYSPEVRTVVETEVDMSTEDVDLKAHLRLKDYNVGKDCNITAVSPSPFETLPSKVVTVNFENLSGGERYYLWGRVGDANASLRITAPSGPDNSPSNTDFGSFGLVLYKGSTVLWTGSVVTHNYNIIARNRTPLKITMRENSTTHVFVDLRNPSTENLTVDYVFILDGNTEKSGGAEIPGRGNVSLSFLLKNLSVGSHLLTFFADPDDDIEETNETDNTVTFHINVVERAFLLITNRTPGVESILIREGEEVVFSVNVSTNDPENVTTEWFLSGNKVGNGLMYVFRTDYNSSSNSPYHISFRASHPECGNITLNWTVTVLNVNRPPTLQVNPKNQTLHTTVGESVEFSAAAEDPDGDAVEINWYVNNTFSRKGEVFNFTPDAEGTYNITVEASDTVDTVFFTWTLYVSSPPPPPKPATIINRTPKEKTLVLYESESIEMRVGLQMGDWHLQNVKWYLGENVVGEGVYNYTFQSSYMGLGSSQFSPYHLSFQALFDEGVLWENWTIIVLDVNRDPTILNVSITISNISGREGRMVNLSANAVDPDGDALNFVWYVDGEEALEGREGIIYLQPGNHTITLNVSDGKGGRCIYVRVISVPPAEGEANGEREVPLLKEKRISLYVLLIIAVIVILFLYRSLALSKPPREEDYFE